MEFGVVRFHPKRLLRLRQFHTNNLVLKLLKLIETSQILKEQMIFENFNFLRICNFIMIIGP